MAMQVALTTVAAAAVLAVVASGCDPAGTEPPDPGTPVTLPAATGWDSVRRAPVSPQFSRHDDVAFISPSRGWLVNVRGEIHRTDDGGATWFLIYQQANTFFRSVGFATDLRGWVGNLNWFNAPLPDNALYATTDGGSTWQNITSQVSGPEPVGICGLQVYDAATIFAVGRWNGPAVFVRSLDSGATWQSLDLAPYATGLVDVHFFSRTRGVAVGGLGVGNSREAMLSSRTVVMLTEDGGDTWTPRYTSATTGKWAWKISFPTPDTGYVSTQGLTGDGIVLKSTDGGLTWQELQVGAAMGFSGIGFVTAQIGWVASDTVAYQTTNGGTTWEAVTLGSSVNRFRFLSPVSGYAVGRAVYRFSGSVPLQGPDDWASLARVAMGGERLARARAVRQRRTRVPESI
jgi:photosystem II stability/assembly factor-like uncharacterized protein